LRFHIKLCISLKIVSVPRKELREKQGGKVLNKQKDLGAGKLSSLPQLPESLGRQPWPFLGYSRKIQDGITYMSGDFGAGAD
jgi:hypothetical protein